MDYHPTRSYFRRHVDEASPFFAYLSDKNRNAVIYASLSIPVIWELDGIFTIVLEFGTCVRCCFVIDVVCAKASGKKLFTHFIG